MISFWFALLVLRAVRGLRLLGVAIAWFWGGIRDISGACLGLWVWVVGVCFL